MRVVHLAYNMTTAEVIYNMIAIIDYDCDYLLKPTENIAL